MSGLFKSSVIKGNKLTEFAQTTATVGIVIPWGRGRYPVDGNVIWAPLPPKENRTVKRQGKGGVKQESFTYTLPYFVAFGKGPIYGFWWIKRNGKVVHTQDPAAPIEDAAYAAKWAQKVTFYYGTDSQMPDSTIESYEGTGRVSAHRGICGFVIEPDDVTEGGGAVPSYEAVPMATPPELILTSKPYAQLFYDQAKSRFAPTGGSLDTKLFDSDIQEDEVSVVFAPTGGELLVPPVPEMNDDMDTVFAPTGGEILTPPVPEMNDDADVSFAPTTGELKSPPQGDFTDDVDASFAPTGGSLDTVVVPAYTTTATPTISSTSGSWGGYTLRCKIPASALVAGSKIRLTLKAPAGNSVVIASAALGRKAASGDQYDYLAAPTAVLFSGAAGTTIAAGGSVVADEVVITVPSSADFVLSAYFTTAANMSYGGGNTGWESWYRAGNDVTTVNTSSYTSLGANTAALISKVEVFSP